VPHDKAAMICRGRQLTTGYAKQVLPRSSQPLVGWQAGRALDDREFNLGGGGCGAEINWGPRRGKLAVPRGKPLFSLERSSTVRSSSAVHATTRPVPTTVQLRSSNPVRCNHPHIWPLALPPGRAPRLSLLRPPCPRVRTE
jgi:hypothetical protein